MITDDELTKLEHDAEEEFEKQDCSHPYEFRRIHARLIAGRCAEECDQEKIRFRDLGLHAESIGALYCRDRIRALIPTDKED